MLARTTLRGVAWSALSFASSGRALLVFGAPLTSCVPERSLSSYANGTNATPAIASAQPDQSASDASDMTPSTSSTTTSPTTATPLAGTSRGAPEGALPGEAALDGTESNVEGSSATAPAPGRLECRAECSCELRDDRDFMFCATPVTRDEAVARCEAAGGTLASVEDAVQNEWLTERMQTLATDDFWLSGSDLEDEGVWRWEDGRIFYDQTADAASPGPFAPWQPMQPNDVDGEDCLRSVDGTWRDLDCGAQIAYVCQG